MATIEQLLRQADEATAQIAALRNRLSHAPSYSQKRTLVRRIRELEDRLDALYRRYMRALHGGQATLYNTRKKPKTQAGLAVRMDVSTDGRYFSNPSPKIGNGKRVWVRAQIDIAQKSPFSTAKTEIPELIRCTWVIPTGWTKRDVYSRFGRIEYVVSLPLIITREFTSPSSGSTKAKFGMYADPYYMDDPDGQPAAESQIEQGEVTAELATGSYHLYARTANVYSARSTLAVPAEGGSFLVDDDADTLWYTDGGYYVTARLITTGSSAGKYIVTEAEGITLTEVYTAT